MRRSLSRILPFFFLLPGTAKATPPSLDTYSFPFRDPYFASFLLPLLKPSEPTAITFEVDGLPGREKIRFVEGRQKIKMTLYRQKRPAPLIYVLPGLGASGTEESGVFLAERLYQKGFSVIVMPSTFFWRFALSQSTHAVPGYSLEDARALRRLMVAARDHARTQWGLQITRSAVMGFSMGGINTAFVMKLERENPVLGLEKAVMINPPLSIPYAVTVIDNLAAIGENWSLKTKDSLWGALVNAVLDAREKNIRDPSYFSNLHKKLNLSQKQLQFLIGYSFKKTLAETVFLGHEITDLGLLKIPASHSQRSARLLESQNLPFRDYMEKGVLPYWSRQLGRNPQEILEESNVISLKDLFARDSAFHLVHNMDDFLTRPEELESVAQVMGDRAVIYPTGGHLGNLWYPQNQEDLFKLVQDLL